MQQSVIETFDPISGTRVPVLAGSGMQWSSAKHWGQVKAEQHGFLSVETPEFVATDNLLAVHLSSPVTKELMIEGKRSLKLHQPGDMALFPAQVPGHVRVTESHEVLLIAVPPALLAHTAVGGHEAGKIVLTKRTHFTDRQCEHIARALKAEAESGYPCGPLYADSLALALAARLLDGYSATRVPLDLHKGGMAPGALRRVLDYIHDHLGEELHLDSLAQVAGLSEFRFAHNFKTATGVAPHQYVIHQRMERGKQMLRGTRASVIDVAQAVGCQTSTRFTVLFKRATGITPSAYRLAFW